MPGYVIISGQCELKPQPVYIPQFYKTPNTPTPTQKQVKELEITKPNISNSTNDDNFIGWFQKWLQSIFSNR